MPAIQGQAKKEVHNIEKGKAVSIIPRTPRAKIQPAPQIIEPLTKAQRELIGRLLVEVLEGSLVEETRREICALDISHLPRPFHHLVSFVQGSSASNKKTAFELSKDIAYFAKNIYQREKQ